MKIKICAPSYKRPDKVDTLKYIPSCRIYVSNDELDEYKKNYPNSDIIGVEPKYQGNISRIRNHILDREMADDCVVCIIDDDMRRIGYHENHQMIFLKTEEEIYKFIQKYTDLAEDWGIKFWGINVNKDPQSYWVGTPFSLAVYIGSPFGVHFKHDVRYDEKFSLKEDYDFILKFLNKYRKALRVNKFFYNVKQVEQTGGCATYRNLEREMSQIDLLIKKWGSKIVKTENLSSSHSHLTYRKRRFDINPYLHIPIRGV